MASDCAPARRLPAMVGATDNTDQRTTRPVPALSFSRLLRIGEGRTVKRLASLADEVIALDEEYTALTDRA